MPDKPQGSHVAECFTATHHALLFAWLSKAAIERAGTARGEEAVLKAVRRYGRERGGRMALRAHAAGDTLSMANFMAYGEWQAAPGESEQTVVQEEGQVRSAVHRCPWSVAWDTEGLTPYGRFYCLEIDSSLVKGYNASLDLDVLCTRPNDGKDCVFVFRGVEETVQRKGAVMSWEYHCGHLYKTVSEVLEAELGDVGPEVKQDALKAFSGRFGEEAAAALETWLGTDFTRLPDGAAG
jgi:hypothetical protein